ncbi:MAG: GAF domain-containing protein [bacterium JZ-2024 1]
MGVKSPAAVIASRHAIKHSSEFAAFDFPGEQFLRRKRFLVCPGAIVAAVFSPFSPMTIYSLNIDERRMGILCVGSTTETGLSSDDQDFFTLLADHLAVALQNAHLN